MSTIAYNLRIEWLSSVHLYFGHAMRRRHIVAGQLNTIDLAQHLPVGRWFDRNYRGKCSRLPSFITPTDRTTTATMTRITLILVFSMNSPLLWSDVSRFFGLIQGVRKQFMPYPPRKIGYSCRNDGGFLVKANGFVCFHLFSPKQTQ